MGDKRDSKTLDEAVTDLSRRDFIALSVAAGLAAAAGSALGAAQPVVETGVTIKTPDGTCDAAFFHPPTGSHPGVLI
jgi:carboxymethylenebutenolidase